MYVRIPRRDLAQWVPWLCNQWCLAKKCFRRPCGGSSRFSQSLCWLRGNLVRRIRHSPRMCYQHPNGVMSLLKHLAISVRFTMKAALFISDFTGANHIWHPFRPNDRFERALRQFPTSEATSWTEHINIRRQTRFVQPPPCDLLHWICSKLHVLELEFYPSFRIII